MPRLIGTTGIRGELVRKVCDDVTGKLDLGSQRLHRASAAGMQELADALVGNESITKLDLRKNGLGELPVQAMRPLAKAIGESKGLLELDLSGNRLSALPPEAMQLLAAAIDPPTHQSCLTSLNLLGNKLGALSAEAMQPLAGALARHHHLATLNLRENELGQLTEGAARCLGGAIGKNDALRKLNLRQNGLGKLSAGAMRALGDGIGNNESITWLNLMGNDLGKLPAEAWEPLAAGIGSSRSITALSLQRNELGKLSAEAVALLAKAIGDNTRIAQIYLTENKLGDLSTAAMEPLAQAIGKHRGIVSLVLTKNGLGKKHAGATATMISSGTLHDCELDKADRRALRRRLGTFAHAAAAWQPGVALGPRAHAEALLDGLWPHFSTRVLAQRLLWLGICVAVALLPTAYVEASEALAAPPATNTTGRASLALTFGVLQQHCDAVPPALENAYADAVALFALVLAVVAALAARNVVLTKLTSSLCGGTGGGGKGAKPSRTKVLFAKMQSILVARSQNLNLSEMVGGENPAFKAAEARVQEDMRARDSAFHFLVQVLCCCNALGGYVAAAPTGGLLCRAAHVGLVVFYKPLAFQLWYCLLVLLDTSRVRLRHTVMTGQLCHIVQLLLAIWAIVCGGLSLPLLVAFPMFGVLFVAPTLLLMRWKKNDLALLRFRNSAEGYAIPGRLWVRSVPFSAIPAGPYRDTLKFHNWKDEWGRRSPAEQSELLGVEQLFYRLRGYSAFAACVFGAQLWPLYQGGDWAGTMRNAGAALRLSLPVWHLPTLRLSFRWPTDLSLPQQLPAFVAVGFAGMELGLKVWRSGSNRAGLTTSEEILLRGGLARQRSGGDGRCAEGGALEHVHVANPVAFIGGPGGGSGAMKKKKKKNQATHKITSQVCIV